MRARFSCTTLFFVIAFAAVAGSISAARIDATADRTYRITKQHGPWMIMVASFSERHETVRVDGLSPVDAANQLVYALRKRGIPAYTFQMSEADHGNLGTDALGRTMRTKAPVHDNSISVVAGNYPTVDDSTAQKTRDFIKRLSLKDLNLESWINGGGLVFRQTPGQPGPFSGAFLTINPLFTQEEVAKTKRDPLILRLNGNSEYSILRNKGKFTLAVATFKGRSQTGIGERDYQKAYELFKPNGTLDDAAERAWKVAKMLREGIFSGSQQGQTFEAYVYHDKFQSLVTVGSFDSPQDPRLIQMAHIFRAKQQTGTNGKSFTTGESIIIPGDPAETVIFDPVPTLIPVPQIR
ncbi:MAG: hypothetical protein HQ518_03695 [Rhodopirellula sp.]|nr:hypothetical protein [Rhodopirellula sp.]